MDAIILPPCSPANSFLDSELQLYVQQQTLKSLKVLEAPEGFYVAAQFVWSKDKTWYLTTLRDRFQPKVYKDLRRLNGILKRAGVNSFDFLHNQSLPAGEGKGCL